MSVDTVNYALTNVRMRFQRNPENFSLWGLRKLLAICDCMRDLLMRGDVAGFDAYVNSVLTGEPDAADFILEELFYELGFPKGVREQLDAALAAE